MQYFLSTDEPSLNTPPPPDKWRCTYCHKVYTRESWYRKHTCEKKKRFDQEHNMDFIRGHYLYTHWRKRNNWLRRGKEPTTTEFVNSPYFKRFMELVTYTNTNWVISALKYLDYLIDMRIADAKWCSDDTLRLYREHTRRNEDPIIQTRTTHEAIRKFCEKHEIKDRREFFRKVGTGTALQMITTNQLSPWVLFGYDLCVTDLLSRVNDDWLCSVNEYLNNNYWINRIKASTDIRQAIQTECERLFLDE
jgi:hypothetical protein